MGDWRFTDNQRWLAKNLIRANSDFVGEPSTSIWANQNNPIRYNAASTVSRGGRSSVNVMSENLNLNSCVGGPNPRSPGDLLTPDGISQDYLNMLQTMLTSRNPEIINKIVEGVLEPIFLLMADRHGHQFFNKLIDLVNNYQLQLIVAKITSHPELLIYLSLTPYG